MARIELEVFSDQDVSGIRRRQASSATLGRFFTHIPPKSRRVLSGHHCTVGKEMTRDYWYSHETTKRGDLKLCREHEVAEIGPPYP